MPRRIDLHIHTAYSDGAYSTVEIIDKCVEAKLDIISITDHDTIDAIPEITEIAKQHSIEVIPGVELSSEVMNYEVHILGYFIDINNTELTDYLKFFREERLRRAIRIIKNLNSLGFNLTLEDVLKTACNSVAVGRPHIAQAMFNRGLISSYYEAFNKYIGNNGPAYEKKVHISPISAFKIINDAGGLAIIAHPSNMPQEILKHLIDEGVDGIEVIHPSHSDFQVKNYINIANSYFLLSTGGSDFHGGKRNDYQNLGKYYVGMSHLTAMRKRILRNIA